MNIYSNHTISINIEFEGQPKITLPVNPSNLTINRSASNNNINIIGLGQVTRKGEPGLITMQIKSFFPHPFSKYIKYDRTPEEYIDIITKIWETQNINNKVPRIYTIGLEKNIDMFFVIDKFNYEFKGGDLDVGFDLSIKEYKPYGTFIREELQEGMGGHRAASTIYDSVPGYTDDKNPTTEKKTYAVKPNDSLWSIAKTCTGSGDNWKELYEANKDIIGTDTQIIEPGQILTLPSNWKKPSAKPTKSSKPAFTGNQNGNNIIEKDKEVPNTSNNLITAQQKLDAEYAAYTSEVTGYVTLMGTFMGNLKAWESNKYINPIDKFNMGYKEGSLEIYTSKLLSQRKNALTIYNDVTKSPEERAAALRQLRLDDLKLYSRDALLKDESTRKYMENHPEYIHF